jgi:hypothetical protein
MSRPGGFATLDAMEVGNGGMSATEQQAIFSLYGLIKTPLYVGADVTTLEGATLEVYKNKDIIAWNQDSLGVPGRQIRKAGDPNGELWGGPLAGGARAAVLLNRGAKAMNISVTWEELRMAGAPNYGAYRLILKNDYAMSDMPMPDSALRLHFLCRCACTERMSVTDAWSEKVTVVDSHGIAEIVPPQSAVAFTIRPAGGRGTY